MIQKLSVEEKKKTHEFWDTQPVPKMGKYRLVFCVLGGTAQVYRYHHIAWSDTDSSDSLTGGLGGLGKGGLMLHPCLPTVHSFSADMV